MLKIPLESEKEREEGQYELETERLKDVNSLVLRTAHPGSLKSSGTGCLVEEVGEVLRGRGSSTEDLGDSTPAEEVSLLISR